MELFIVLLVILGFILVPAIATGLFWGTAIAIVEFFVRRDNSRKE